LCRTTTRLNASTKQLSRVYGKYTPPPPPPPTLSPPRNRRPPVLPQVMLFQSLDHQSHKSAVRGAGILLRPRRGLVKRLRFSHPCELIHSTKYSLNFVFSGFGSFYVFVLNPHPRETPPPLRFSRLCSPPTMLILNRPSPRLRFYLSCLPILLPAVLRLLVGFLAAPPVL